MLKNIQNIALFFLIGIYIIQLGTQFIGDFAEELQELRRQHKIAKTELIENKKISLAHWNSLEEKNEILLENIYYDVVSYQIKKDLVIVKAVRDTFDGNFKKALKNIIAHKNLSNNGKKKSLKFFSPSVLCETLEVQSKNLNSAFDSKPVVFTSIGNANKIPFSTFRPPCYSI